MTTTEEKMGWLFDAYAKCAGFLICMTLFGLGILALVATGTITVVILLAILSGS